MSTTLLQILYFYVGLSFGVPLSSFYPYGSLNGDSMVPPNDDDVYPAIHIRTPFPFFNHTHGFLFVNTNGDITFLSGSGTFTPPPFPYQQNTRIIAAYWGDVDTRDGGDIWYRESTNQMLLRRASSEIRAVFPQQSQFHATWMFIATWNNVAHYHYDLSKRCTFQCVLVTDGTHAFVMFQYSTIEWEPAQVGFDAGDGTHYYSVPKSITPEIQNIPTMSNIGVPGKFIFRVDLAAIERATTVDECVGQECHNNGTCIDLDGLNTWKCLCVAGFTGRHCELEINECDSNPCLHNGYCADLFDSYQCHCREGYKGVNCEIDVNECASNPCLHGAVCHDNENDYLCSCPTGYTGRNCQIDIDECGSSPCYNNATCVDRVAGWVCNCLPGYTGRHCHIDIDDCHGNPCQHNGTCLDLVNKFKCLCPDDATGEHCETWIDHCASFPCLHGGTCNNRYGGYNCTCAETWYGHICEYREENITDVCIDLEYTECSCITHQLKQNKKSHKILSGSVGVAIGCVISILTYGLWICLNSIDSKVIPEKQAMVPENEESQKKPRHPPSRHTISRVDRVKGHHDCFTDHTGFDFAKFYVDKNGNRLIPKCRHFKSEA